MNIRNLNLAVVSAVACLAFYACEEKGPVPSFPEAIENSSVTTTEEYIEFTANMDWELSVPVSTIAYFWIDDPDMGRVNVLKGTSGTYKVKIGITDEPDFDNDKSCEVTLKMGGDSRVIAKYTLLKSVREFKTYSCEVDALGHLLFSDEGGWKFKTEETEAVSVAYHRAYGFVAPIKFEAGTSYTVKSQPEWADIELYNASPVAVGKRGICEVVLRIKEGVAYPSAEPLTGNLVFTVRGDESQILKTLAVAFDPVNGFISWEGEVEVPFNGDGTYGSAMSEDAAAYEAEILASEDVIVFAAATFKRPGDSAESLWTGSDVNWVNLTVGEHSQDGLQKLPLTITMSPNSFGKEMRADIYAVPVSVTKALKKVGQWNSAFDAFANEDYTQVRAELQPYKITTLIQAIGGPRVELVAPAEGVVYEKLPKSTMDTSGEVTAADYEEKYANVNSQYSLDYEIYKVETSSAFTVTSYETIVEADLVCVDENCQPFTGTVPFTFSVDAENRLTVTPASSETFEGVLIIRKKDPEYGYYLGVAAVWIYYTPAQ